jgi:hypothetical protein
MTRPSLRFSQTLLCSPRSYVRGAFMFVGLFVFLICSSQLLRAQTDAEVQACKAGTCVSFCKDLGLDTKRTAECVAQCRQSCQPPPPQPVTVTPKYLIVALVYAPPGCTTGGAPSQCGTGSGSSFVDYSRSSANGNKLTIKDSFQLGVTIAYDNKNIVGGLSGGGSYGFSETASDSTAVNVTKTQASDLKVQGNGDGIDHGQDMFVLLLRPSVTLQKSGDQILWSVTNAGNPYEVNVAELRRPSDMLPARRHPFDELGFTNDDYQSILSQDPFGGKVNTSSGHSAVGSITATTSGTFTTGASSGTGLDPFRFWLTGWSFPYEPSRPSPNCNNGVCLCPTESKVFTNDKLTTTTHEDVGQTTVDLFGGVDVPQVYSLKIDTKMVWTSSSTTDNSTESKESATATITCPSTQYTGLTGMQVYWDRRYGSFVFIPYDPGSAAMIHQGQVLDASGHAVSGQLVEMTYLGKTYHTFTAPNGAYRFPSPTGKPAHSGTAQIVTGGIRQTVNVRAIHPLVIRMR